MTGDCLAYKLSGLPNNSYFPHTLAATFMAEGKVRTPSCCNTYLVSGQMHTSPLEVMAELYYKQLNS